MKYSQGIGGMLVFVGSLWAGGACAGPLVTSQELIVRAKEFDGKEIIYRGEVIGDILRRGGYAWLHVQDEQGTISARAPASAAKNVLYTGDYHHDGDILLVEGRFFRADPKRQGEFYIDAENVTVLSQGGVTSHAVSPIKIKTGFFLLGLGLALGILRVIQKRKEKG